MKLKMVFLLMCLMLGAVGCHTVETGNVGVQTCWGRAENSVYREGFYWVGWCDMHDMSTRTLSYTMAGNGTERSTEGSVQVLTREQLSVTLDVSVQFHLNGDHGVSVYRFFGEHYDNDIVHPLVRTAVRDAASEFTALQLVDERARLQVRMQDLVRERLLSTLHSRNVNSSAISIDNILLRNIDLPDSLDNSIANVQRQRQETVQREQAGLTATQESNRLRIEADGAAAAMLIRTRADSDAIRIRAQAQADSNRLVAQSLTPEVLRLRQIESLNSVLSNNSSRVVFLPLGSTPTIMMPQQGTP